MHRIGRLGVRALAAAVLVASPSVAAGTSQATTTARHCVIQVGASSASTSAARCFPAFAAAIAVASGGRIQLPTDNRTGPLSAASVQASNDQAAAAGVTPFNTVIIGIDYTGTGFTGSSLTWTQSAGCGSYNTASMPGGWNDVISSVQNFSGCGSTLYQNSSFGGSTFSVGVNGSASTLGGLKRQASSQKWCTASSC